MKKETLILLGIAAAGVYFFTRRRSDYSGLVTVESPEKITEEEFGTPQSPQMRSPTPIIEQGKSLLQQVKTFAQTTRAKIKRKKALKDTVFLPGMSKPISKKQLQKTIRQQKAKQRKAARMERKVKRKKVGEISIMY